jgi:hypothetical protein
MATSQIDGNDSDKEVAPLEAWAQQPPVDYLSSDILNTDEVDRGVPRQTH